ncbi:hypothetical protein [Paenibacillus lautus]|uniref:hypothetical protein n=1 Tax=Paenibacillus lautus TaxID=1401 RepID=UPI003D2E57F5
MRNIVQMGTPQATRLIICAKYRTIGLAVSNQTQHLYDISYKWAYRKQPDSAFVRNIVQMGTPQATNLSICTIYRTIGLAVSNQSQHLYEISYNWAYRKQPISAFVRNIVLLGIPQATRFSICAKYRTIGLAVSNQSHILFEK